MCMLEEAQVQHHIPSTMISILFFKTWSCDKRGAQQLRWHTGPQHGGYRRAWLHLASRGVIVLMLAGQALDQPSRLLSTQFEIYLPQSSLDDDFFQPREVFFNLLFLIFVIIW